MLQNNKRFHRAVKERKDIQLRLPNPGYEQEPPKGPLTPLRSPPAEFLVQFLMQQVRGRA